MDKLRALETFVAIVDRGSLTAAADALDSSLPAVVRQLAALEAQLGVRLLHRTTRRLSLTEDGRLYLERVRRILADVDEADRSLLASSAAYWIGHSYYARGDFQNASVAFADAYKKYPKGNKAPDTLLELGRSLARMEQVPSACATFAQFDKQFGAGAAPMMKRQVEQEKARLRCG